MRRPTEYESLTDRQVRDVLKTLRCALKKMRAELRRPGLTEFDMSSALAKKQAIAREIGALEQALDVRVGSAA